MNEARARSSPVVPLVLLAIVIALAAYMILREPEPVSPVKKVGLHERPRALPPLAIEDGEGRSRTLDDWKGRVVVMNVWATWCAPCRAEMPSLARMRKSLGDAPVDLVLLSVDQGGPDLVRLFYRDNGLEGLGVYRASFDAAEKALGLPGIPVTILVDREGNEAGRVVGEAVWDRPEVIALLKSLAERAPATEVDAPTASRPPIGPLLR